MAAGVVSALVLVDLAEAATEAAGAEAGEGAHPVHTPAPGLAPVVLAVVYVLFAKLPWIFGYSQIMLISENYDLGIHPHIHKHRASMGQLSPLQWR